MSFSVTLYSFSKRNNSTARPSGGQSFSCTIKQASGTVYPTILVDIGLGTAPSYNYAYIPAFSRYYWIVEHINRGPVWELKLKVDPLASWKGQIGSTSLYVLRASAASDGNILDTYYPALTNSTISIKAGSSLWSSGDAVSLGSGTIVCGIVSENAMFGSICYYALDTGAFTAMCQHLLSDQMLTDNNFSLDDASFALQKALVDPLQYIKSCVWIPGYVSGTDAGVRVQNWNTGVRGQIVTLSMTFVEHSTTISIDNHPQIARGRYLNYPPYTVMWLDVPPFGVVQLDPTILRDSSSITIMTRTDIITGVGTLKILDNNNVLLNSLSAQVGVPINMSQVTRDYLGAATSAVNATANTLQDAIFGNIAGSITAAASGISSATKALCPRVQSMGGTGNFSSLYGVPRLYEQFFQIADEDLSHNGRPLCKIRTPASLGGFIKVLDGDIAAPATDAELEMIRGYLEGGFYYE